MRSRLSDKILAFVAAIVLIGVAVFIILVIHPGGFEGQIAWLFALFPGAFVGAPLADKASKIHPVLGALFWPILVGVTLLWYFALSYAAIKSFRIVSRIFRR